MQKWETLSKTQQKQKVGFNINEIKIFVSWLFIGILLSHIMYMIDMNICIMVVYWYSTFCVWLIWILCYIVVSYCLYFYIVCTFCTLLSVIVCIFTLCALCCQLLFVFLHCVYFLYLAYYMYLLHVCLKLYRLKAQN
jgi:hypothetical protein